MTAEAQASTATSASPSGNVFLQMSRRDTDGDGIPNAKDRDDDNDGVLDVRDFDRDNDGIANAKDADEEEQGKA